jgi:hypothetical protein
LAWTVGYECFDYRFGAVFIIINSDVMNWMREFDGMRKRFG